MLTLFNRESYRECESQEASQQYQRLPLYDPGSGVCSNDVCTTQGVATCLGLKNSDRSGDRSNNFALNRFRCCLIWFCIAYHVTSVGFPSLIVLHHLVSHRNRFSASFDFTSLYYSSVAFVFAMYSLWSAFLFFFARTCSYRAGRKFIPVGNSAVCRKQSEKFEMVLHEHTWTHNTRRVLATLVTHLNHQISYWSECWQDSSHLWTRR